MNAINNRRTFLKNCAALGIGLSMTAAPTSAKTARIIQGKRVGIIGLDTSHSVAFTKALNAVTTDARLKGYRVVAAYPYGSRTIESSVKRIPGYMEDVKAFGVTIVDSIDALLRQVDVVLLETNDGRLHLEQALQVFEAGKRLFIDKPIAASLTDTKAIFEASQKHNISVFSSSSMRYIDNIQALKTGKLIGEITGADAFSPATLEPTHPDLFWYGIHGIEILYSILGIGCERVHRVYTDDTDIVVGIWADGRVGTFRGLRKGKNGYGGTAFGTKGQTAIEKYQGYTPLLHQIVDFFDDGVAPVSAKETIELVAFMEAADESKKRNGEPVSVQALL